MNITNIKKKIQTQLRNNRINTEHRKVLYVLVGCLFVLFIGFQNCQTNNSAGKGAGTSQSLGLSVLPKDFDTPKGAVEWTWRCTDTKKNCTYASRITNAKQQSKFTSNDFKANNKNAKRILQDCSSPPCTYYLHVQAMDSSSGYKSGVITRKAVIGGTSSDETSSSSLEVTGIVPPTSPQTSVTWNWNCNKPPCTFRHVVSASATHAFTNEVYGDTKTITYPLANAKTSGTFYLHIQAKKAMPREESQVTSVRFEITQTLVIVDQIATGTWHSCFLSQGSVKCWGDNSAGQLGLTAGQYNRQYTYR